jgi:hypothetical protein
MGGEQGIGSPAHFFLELFRIHNIHIEEEREMKVCQV